MYCNLIINQSSAAYNNNSNSEQNIMIHSQQDKKLVDQYKLTNLALRKQLTNLNNQIDRILIKKSMKIGLQKLPHVAKKITDPTIMQHEIENLRKRLEGLERDAEGYRGKAGVNYYQKIKQLQVEVQEKDNQMQQHKKIIKQYQRKDKIADVQATKHNQNLNSKIEHRVAKLQQQISRCQKIEKDLMKEINYQQVAEQKTNGYLQELVVRHGQVVSKKQKEMRERSPVKSNEMPQKNMNQTSIGQQQWKQLKKQFLILKQSKQNQQFALNEQNERLRTQIKQWQRKIKDKRKRIQSLNEVNERNKERQSRVYSTLGDPSNGGNDSKVYRYRDRNNSVQYNTKQ